MTQRITQLENLANEPQEDSGFGALQTQRGCLPLTALDVQAKIVGLSAHVTVKQKFRNTLDEPIEATYIFPLPDRAAVTSFKLWVGDREVEGLLKERAEARREYEQAIEEGHRAAIAEEERSGTFNLRVGNLPPGEEATVELTLVGPLVYVDGEAEFRFPLVVAPRYVPGIPLDGPSVGQGTAPDTDQVPDASRVTPPVLLPGFANPVRLSLEVEVDLAGLGIDPNQFADQLQCSLHAVLEEQGQPWKVRLQPEERLNRDFLLRFPVATDQVQTVLSTAAVDGQPGVFALTLVPPTAESTGPPKPRDVVFVLDRSGSMTGWKMVAARRAVGRMIDSLLEQDRFSVLAYDNSIELPPHAQGQLVAADNRNRWRAVEWLGGIDARGGTEAGPALKQGAQLFDASAPDRDRVLVFVTDGQVAGEDSVLRTFCQAAGDPLPRVFALGIDQAVNAGFLRRMAERTRGSCDLVESEDRLDAVMDRVHRTIGVPTLTNLRLEPVGCELIHDSLAPSRIPDLFAGRPATVYGRFLGKPEQLQFKLRATAEHDRPWEQEVAAHPTGSAALFSLWGRARVRDLEDQYAALEYTDAEKLRGKIVAVSLEANVLSRFTAYVAVDRSEVVNQGGEVHEIVQPVELPAGWDGRFAAGGAMFAAASVEKMCQSMQLLGSIFEAPGIDADDLGKVIADTKKLLEKATKSTRGRAQRVREILDQLAAVYDMLSPLDIATEQQRPLERAIELGEMLIKRQDSGEKDPLCGPQWESWIAKVQSILAEIEAEVSGGNNRETFWV